MPPTACATQRDLGQTLGYVWADRYDRDLHDIFVVQDEITAEIVGALQLVLMPAEAAAVAQAPTSDFQAYDFYLRGRQFFHSHVRSKFIEARRLFEQAIECDTNFARAHCGLADCDLMIYSQYDGDKSNLNNAMKAIDRALELEPNLADAHASMGLALSQSGENKKAAEEFQKAIACDPDLYQTQYFWARFCWEQGDIAAAAHHFEQAWRISPRDPQAPFLLMAVYGKLGRKTDVQLAAQATLETALNKLELEPRDSRACFQCSHALAHMERYSEAENMIVRAIELDPSDRIVVYNAACMYATIGETDLALDTLENMPGEPTQMLDWIKNDGDLDSLRDHSRFKIYMKLLEDFSQSPDT